MWGEKAWTTFEKWSNTNYVHKKKNRNRDIQQDVSDETLEQLENPASIFLENCNEKLPGVFKLDKSFYENSGTLAGHTAMADMLSKWLSNTVFCHVTSKKQVCYIQNEKTLLYERGLVMYDLRLKITAIIQMLTRTCRKQLNLQLRNQENHFVSIIESNKSGHHEIDFSENALRGITGDGQVENESNLVEIHHPVLPEVE